MNNSNFNRTSFKSVNEIIMFAKSKGIELSAEQGEKILKLITPPYGELSDEQLDSIAGGSGKGTDDDNTKKCKYCNSTDISRITPQSSEATTSYYELGLMTFHYICNSCHKKFNLYF